MKKPKNYYTTALNFMFDNFAIPYNIAAQMLAEVNATFIDSKEKAQNIALCVSHSPELLEKYFPEVFANLEN